MKNISLDHGDAVLTLGHLARLVQLGIDKYGENMRVAINGPDSQLGSIRDIEYLILRAEKKLSKQETFRRVVLMGEGEGLHDILVLS